MRHAVLVLRDLTPGSTEPWPDAATARTDVLIVGGGLVGLSCAAFLAWHGVRCVLVERHPTILGHPRQRSLTPRVLEMYRQLGLEARIEAGRADFAGPDDYVAVRADTLAGPHTPLDRRDAPDPGENASPCRGTPIDQDRVEALLAARALELGASLRFGVALTAFGDDGAGIRAELSDGTRLRAAYLVAADGADGAIGPALGVTRHGPGALYSLTSLLIEADLRPVLRGRTVHMAYLTRPAPRTYLMALDRQATRWVFGTAGPGTLSSVRAAIGADLPVRVREPLPGRRSLAFDVGAWVASRYRVGRVFLVGDAAHAMPPTGGFGGATGVADAHNLAWKLAYVLRGAAGDALLSTYHDERAPVGEFTMRQALARSDHRFDAADSTAIADRSAVLFGCAYRSAAIAADGPAPDPVPAARLSGAPGTRAPHVALGDGRSTIDWYGRDFVLLAGPRWAGSVAAHRLSADTAARHGLSTGAALLVRPDGVVAWRGVGEPPWGPVRPGGAVRPG